MNKPTENHLELYIRYPFLLLEKEKEWIEYWIQKDTTIYSIAEFFRVFYSTFEEIQRSYNSKVNKPGIIHLKQKSLYKKKTNGFVLAAQTISENYSIYDNVRTFVSDEHKTLIRVINKPEQNKLIAYVLSDFGSKKDIYLLKNGKNNHYLITEPGGKIEIDKKNEANINPLSWETCELYVPIIQVIVFKDSSTSFLTYSFGYTKHIDSITIEASENELVINIHPANNEEIVNKMTLSSSDKSELFHLDSPSITLPVAYFTSSESLISLYN